MRTLFFASVLCAAVLYATCSPVPAKAPENEATSPAPASTEATAVSEEAPKLKETGRQSEDDDDDDDDDDLGLGVDDDDDDDDDEGAADDDDDDDDYFESFFDDLLGEDDDDDDDDSSPSTGSQQPVVAAPEPEIQEAAPQEEAQSAVEEVAEGTDNPVDASENETDALIDKDPSELEAAASVQNNVQAPIEVQPVAADEAEEEDEDDEDDDDDGLPDLVDDDDDDDEDEEDDEEAADDDDDDDDDDEADLEDVLEAKRSRSLEPATSRMPSTYITKYNRFVDNIVSRINRILGKSYDPVRVRLHSNTSNKNTSTNSSKKKNSTKKRKTNAKRKQSSKKKATNKMAELTIPRMTESEAREPAFVLISKNGGETRPKNSTVIQTRVGSGPSSSNKKNKRKNSGNKTKAASKKTSKPRATLFGLSSIRRDGDVMVNMMANHTTVKSNFVLGPLTLRVEKEFGSGARRELKSATATTAEMHGRLTLRVVNGGVATLHSIKVLQPKQIRIDSPDEHDKTREYMWRRTARIASLVAQKLTSATKSMLMPPPRSPNRHSH